MLHICLITILWLRLGGGDEELDSKKLNPEDIIEYGLKADSSVCRRVLNLFIQLFAVEVSNMCLRSLCFSGIYLGGLIYFLKQKILWSHDERHFDFFLGSITSSISKYMIERLFGGER
jgi:glucokinase